MPRQPPAEWLARSRRYRPRATMLTVALIILGIANAALADGGEGVLEVTTGMLFGGLSGLTLWVLGYVWRRVEATAEVTARHETELRLLAQTAQQVAELRGLTDELRGMMLIEQGRREARLP